MTTSSGPDPRHWFGNAGGRHAAWRRSLLRRVLSLTLLGGAALLVLGRLEAATQHERGTVVISARPVAAGAALAAADLRTAQVDARAIAPGAFHTVESAVGQRVGGPLGAGEQLTRSRLLGPALMTGQPPGTAVLWLPTVADPSRSGLAVGATVDGYVSGQRDPAFTGAVLLSVSNDTPDFATRSTIVANDTRWGALVALKESQIGDVFAGQRPDAGPTAYVLVTQ